MALSYGELAQIGAMTNEELQTEYTEQEKDLEVITDPKEHEDTEDTINAILSEMESRGMPHP